MENSSVYIKLLGPDHLLYLGGLVFLIYLLFFKTSWIKERRALVDKVLIFVIIIQQLLLYGSYFIYTGFDLSESLPIHVCRICSLLVLTFLITKNPRVFEITTYFGLFALLSFIYPSKVYGLNHPIGYSFFICHATNFLAGSYGILIHDMKLRPGSQNRAFIGFLIYLSLVVLINPLVDGNYFYLKHKPVFAFLPDYIYIPLVSLATYAYFLLGNKFHLLVQEGRRDRAKTFWDILTD